MITSSTSLIISGSSAEVGSSNSMMRGSIHSDCGRWRPAAADRRTAQLGVLRPPARGCGPARDSCIASSLRLAIAQCRARWTGPMCQVPAETVRCGKQVELLEHHADRPADLVLPGFAPVDGDPFDGDLARVMLFKLVDAADQRRFAGTRGAAYHHLLARIHVERHALQRLEIAEAFDDGVHLDNWPIAHVPILRSCLGNRPWRTRGRKRPAAALCHHKRARAP